MKFIHGTSFERYYLSLPEGLLTCNVSSSLFTTLNTFYHDKLTIYHSRDPGDCMGYQFSINCQIINIIISILPWGTGYYQPGK